MAKKTLIWGRLFITYNYFFKKVEHHKKKLVHLKVLQLWLCSSKAIPTFALFVTLYFIYI